MYESKRYESIVDLQSQVILLRTDCQFRVQKEHITMELYIHFEDPIKEFAQLDNEFLKERLEKLALATQMMINQELLEVNAVPIQRYVVDASVKFWNSNPQFPVIRFLIESDRINLKPNILNQIVLRRKEEIKDYDTTESWLTPGFIEKAVRVNLLRSKTDHSIMESICGSRADFDNGETRATGGTDVIEFKYLENWGEVGEVDLKDARKGLLSRLKC
ncbi:MAG: hypothetical protein ACFFBD_08760 [Candidatus Hodarchaeota archaeon]